MMRPGPSFFVGAKMSVGVLANAHHYLPRTCTCTLAPCTFHFGGNSQIDLSFMAVLALI